MKFTPALATAITATVALTLIPSSVNADAYYKADLSGDVQQVSFDEGEVSATTVPHRTNGDIVGGRVALLPRTVKIRIRFRDLTRVGQFRHLSLLRSNKAARMVIVTANSSNWRGKVRVENREGKAVACSVTRTIDYPNNVLSVVVPRSCLGDPTWIQMAHATLVTNGGRFFIDEAYRAYGALKPNYAFGPRVYL